MSSSPENIPLHPIEQKVLAVLDGKGWVDFDSLVNISGLLSDQVRRSISWLSSKGLISVKEFTRSALTTTQGDDDDGYPVELFLVQTVKESDGPVSLKSLRAAFKSDKEFSAAFGKAKSAGWITTTTNQDGVTTVQVKDKEKAQQFSDFFLSLRRKETPEEDVPPQYSQFVRDLVSRNIIKKDESRLVSIAITDEGKRALEQAETEPSVQKLTPEIIAKIRLSNAEVKLRPIDVQAPAPHFYPGKRHPVKEFVNIVREVYLSMGFNEIIGDSIQSSFWNFDALFTPQDHPARELQDTFYIKGARDEKLTRKGVVASVAAAHENGWKTGSKGWRYSWDIEEARRLVLRTHNTALTIRATSDSGGGETRVFSVGRVYRNESLDYKHLAELHQMEGIVIGEGLNLRHLMGVLTAFYGKLGMSGVKLWPSYFPYTEPSMQVMVYYAKVGKWLEMGGAGIFRPEVTLPLGVTKPVLAWGCGLERLLMLQLEMEDIRGLYANDLGWLRERRAIIASSQDIL